MSETLQAKKRMKTAKKTRPKILKHRSVASKKVRKQRLSKVALTLEWIWLSNEDTTSQINRIGSKAVKKKHRKYIKRLTRIIEKIVWIFFEAVVVFGVGYLLTKALP